jgi:hypothetical protein
MRNFSRLFEKLLSFLLSVTEELKYATEWRGYIEESGGFITKYTNCFAERRERMKKWMSHPNAGSWSVHAEIS